jgi:lysophospholipase L1-like esterase
MIQIREISHRFPTTTNLLILLFSCAVCFGICEIALRIVTPDWLSYRINIIKNSGQMHYGSDADSTSEVRNGLFYRFTPYSQFPITHPEYYNQAHIDGLGGRRVPSHAEITQTTMVPVYGDSFTFGVGVEDHETFVSHLATGSNQSWLNLGVPGSAIHNHLDTLILRHSELRNPKKVIFAFFLGNDFADLINADEKKSNNHVNKIQRYGEKNDSILNKINAVFYHTAIIKNSYFLQFVRAKLVSLINKNTLTYVNPIFKIMQNNPEYTQVAQSALIEQLDRLVKLKQQYHFKPLILIIPDRYQLDEKARNYQAKLYGIPLQSLYSRRPNALLMNALKQRSIAYIDASSCLSQYYTSEKLYYIQDDHFTAQGQHRFAECVQQQVGEFLLN